MKTGASSRRTGLGAFTLVELLVVLAILVTLSALLLGGVGMANKRVDLSRCTQNLRQLQIAFHSYVSDHNGVLPDKNPKRLYPYLGIPDTDLYRDTAYTCPAVQRGPDAAVGPYHRTTSINIYATTEKVTDPDRITRIVYPSQMLLFTEGSVISEAVAPDGRKGKTYFSTTRLEHADGLPYPHANRQNAVFVDGSVRPVDKVEFYQGGRWNTPFWRGY